MQSAATAAAQPTIMQAVSGDLVNIKNTFLDDWDGDEALAARRMALRRDCRTCPTFAPEPDSELSTDAEPLDDEPLHAAEALATGGADPLDAEPSDAPEALAVGPELPRRLELAPLCGRGARPWGGIDGASTAAAPRASFADLAECCATDADGVAAGRRRRRGGAARTGRAPANSPVDSSPASSLASSPRGTPCSSPSSSPSAAARRPRGGKSAASKLWCHIFIDPSMLRPGFELAKKVIGHGGGHTRRIFDATGAKIRLRGRGSGHLEGAFEAPVPIMLAVTTEKHEVEQFQTAVRMSAELLGTVEAKYRNWCERRQEKAPEAGTCYWVGEASAGDALEKVLPPLGLKLP